METHCRVSEKKSIPTPSRWCQWRLWPWRHYIIEVLSPGWVPENLSMSSGSLFFGFWSQRLGHGKIIRSASRPLRLRIVFGPGLSPKQKRQLSPVAVSTRLRNWRQKSQALVAMEADQRPRKVLREELLMVRHQRCRFWRRGACAQLQVMYGWWWAQLAANSGNAHITTRWAPFDS